ncbi:HPP family protein [Fundidesulfovibrio agrisoli]|uniref:HPP family protein n=1 Tax=Fundidesulfovibrio agrisoli TaxID=2922717 RepID=UPI001FACD7B3|nr:HPP family protein [Fundidesulfovibrio agrisoli]
MKAFFAKMKGSGKGPPLPPLKDAAWSWFGAFLGMGAVGFMDSLLVAGTDLTLLIGSFGASSVLLYAAPRSPLAQPRNLLGGHVLSALVGVAVRLCLPGPTWLACALAVACAIALMQVTGTLHPPGGATAFIAVAGGPKIAALGFTYALIPAGAGALVLLAVALLVNNLAEHRRYPEYWL